MASCIICGANGRMGRTLVRAVCASSAWRCAACVDPRFRSGPGHRQRAALFRPFAAA